MLNLQTVMNRVLEIESQLDSGDVAGAKDDVQVLKEDLEKSGCQIDDSKPVADARDQHLINKNFNKSTGGK